MITRIFFTLVMISFAAVSPAQEKPDLNDAYRLLEYWLDAQKDYENLPGISVGFIHDQDLAWAEAFGQANVEDGIEAQTNTIYSICSISKLFTAIAIMQLRDAGKLRLDDEVSQHLSWFTIRQAYEHSGPITIRSLLTHSSGLPRQSDFPYWTGPDFDFPTLDQIKAQVHELETLYPASTYFQYSNFGLSILGAIVQEVSGVSYESYVEENILDVLGLRDTRSRMPVELANNQLAKGYNAMGRDRKRKPLEPFFTEGVTAAAGFTSTVEDLAKFASWQLRLLDTNEKEVLKVSTLREMHRVHWMDPDWQTSWGLGFSVRQADGQTIVGHGGSCPGYRSTLSIIPKKKMAYVVMINASGTNPGKYAGGMADVIGKAMDASPVEPEGINLEDYAGTYDSQPWGGEEVVLPWYGNLAVLNLPTDNPSSFSVLQHVEGDTFRRKRSDGELGETVIFERGPNGQVVRLWQHQNYATKLK
jgi:CubicO group peptidase (beta-lactamase class C family)